MGVILFNVYIDDLFYLTEMTEACNYAGDTTLHACRLDLKGLATRLEHDATPAIECRHANKSFSGQARFLGIRGL